jgi:cellobiose phosphorylase
MTTKWTMKKTGQFSIDAVDKLSYTYFPLCNEHGLKASITPSLNGSLNIDQNTFFLLPVSNEDLHNSMMNRNLYLRVNNDYVWSTTGRTPYQMLNEENVMLEADFLTHKITRQNKDLTVEVESFISTEDNHEIHRTIITNNSQKSLNLKPVLNIPMYSRSADNLRDHRHVSALLNKAKLTKNGMINQPTFLFDERGHHLNHNRYSIDFYTTDLVFKQHWPVLEEFIGEGRHLMRPEVVEKNLNNTYKKGDVITGYELTGGFEFEAVDLQPGQQVTLYYRLGINTSDDAPLNAKNYDQLKKENKAYWTDLIGQLECQVQDEDYSAWLKWVTIQPTLRRLFGNSFLPHHDYGKGGRGWRDLWQDQLSLILMDAQSVREALLNNFKGVRIDGSNATIIGDQPGDFKSDRNNIPRVWMDHGSWPWLTTKLYLDKTGDLGILFEEVTYFNDRFTHYTKRVSNKITHPHKGTILEHLLIQNIVPFFNVGKHNNILLEDADWNDGLDMAPDQGESVAFTAFYGRNLVELGTLLEALEEQGIETIELIEDVHILLREIDLYDVSKKRTLLHSFFDGVSQETVDKDTFKVSQIKEFVIKIGHHLLNQVQKNEWLQDAKVGWFNSYYDNDGQRLDSVNEQKMNLTPQVFAIMSHSATKQQVEKIIRAADQLLFDSTVGGYKLNTPYNELKTNMGRLFGFGYGHKENGAMFSHMAVMYANALYQRDFVKAGRKVLKTIYEHVSDIHRSKMYPGLPEYVDPKGRGMYPYLTGSASWYLLTVVTEVFGIKGQLGDIVLEPKLMREEFDQNKAFIKTMVQGRTIQFTYINPLGLEYGMYQIKSVTSNDKTIDFKRTKAGVILSDLPAGDTVIIELSQK